MPPRVSSENTTPKPKVSSAALRSQTVISCSGPSCWASAAKYSPPGPPPMTAMRTLAARRAAQQIALQLAGGGPRQAVHELDGPRVLVRRDLLLGERLQLGR